MSTKMSNACWLGFAVLAILFSHCALFAQTWQYLGARWCVNVSSDISVGYSGTTRSVYLAAKQGTVLVSTGSNFSWTKLANFNAPYNNPDFVTCESANPQVVYAGVNDYSQGGVWKSTDGGVSWSSIYNNLGNRNLTRMAISPSNSSVLYIGGKGQGQGAQATFAIAYKSIDGGSTWTALTNGLPTSGLDVTRIVLDPVSANYLYIGGTSGGISRSIDGGASWSAANSGISNTDVAALAITPQNTTVLYAGSLATQGTRIYKTTNKGDSWTAVYSSTGVDINDLKVDPFSASTIYAATSTGILKSTDAGANWTAKNTGIVNLDIRAISVDNQSPSNRVYAGTYYSFYYTSDGGANWSEQASGTDLVTSGGVSVYNDDVYSITGNKTTILATRRLSGSTSWDVLTTQSVDLSHYFIAKDFSLDWSNANTMNVAGSYIPLGYNAAWYGPKIIRSVNGGAAWALTYSTQQGIFTDPNSAENAIAVDPSLSSKLFSTSHYVGAVFPLRYSLDAGNSWTQVSTGGNLDNYFSVAFSKTSGSPGSASQILFASGGNATALTEMIKSTNAGSAWVSSKSGIADHHVSKGVTVDPINGSNIYATTDDGFFGNIYKSSNAGLSWQVVAGNPPPGADPVPDRYGAIVHHPNRSGCIYAVHHTTAWEVLQSVDGGLTWPSLSSGLPSDKPISHVVFKANTSSTYPQYLYAGTDNGVYKIDLRPFPPPSVQTTVVVSGSTSLSWTTNPEPDLSGYNIYRGWLQLGGADPTYVKINASPVSGTTYIDNNFEPISQLTWGVDLYHRYRITAVDNQGQESDKSVYVEAYFTHVASGPISSSQTWQIDVQVAGNTSMLASNTLTILPGAKVRFATGNSVLLAVYGALNATGNAGSHIVFTSNTATPAPDDWYTISLYGGPNTMKYCDVQYNDYGVYVKNTNPSNVFQNCTFQNCAVYGVYSYLTLIQPNAVKFTDCTLSNNAYGMTAVNSRVDFLSTNPNDATKGILNNGAYGTVQYDGGRLYLSGFRVANNGTSSSSPGVWVGRATAYTIFTPDSSVAGNNWVYGNSGSQINIYQTGGFVFLGDATRGGYNHVYGNCPWIVNGGTTLCRAQRTYWGAPSPPYQCPPPANCFSAYVDYSNCLSAGNIPVAEPMQSPNEVTRSLAGTGQDAAAGLVNVIAKMDERNYDRAISMLDSLIQKKSDAQFLNNYAAERFHALIGRGDLAGAEGALTWIRSNVNSFDADELRLLAQTLALEKAGRNPGVSIRPELSKNVDLISVRDRIELLGNYPNPFNAATEIRYSLPAPMRVTLKVFDVLGREVKTLVDEEASPGDKALSFDASSLPSGIYFYRLQAGNFVAVRKMLLMK